MNTRLGCLLVTLLVPLPTLAGSLPQGPCGDQPDSFAVDQCLGNKIEAAEKQLDMLFKQTLETLPDSDPSDSRKGKEQLRKAQKAWYAYRDEQCAFIGGIQGGSNPWVSHFAAACELAETNKRIQFFKNVPWGNH